MLIKRIERDGQGKKKNTIIMMPKFNKSFTASSPVPRLL